MATNPPALTVILAPTAQDDLWEIWGDNAERYDADHADGYLTFLKDGINRLATHYTDGKPLEGFSEFRFITLKKSRRGHGHYVIYKVEEDQQIVQILRIYHTSMDVMTRLRREFH